MGIFSRKPKEQISSIEERLKTDFITLSSHQLRTPLSVIKWFTEILLRQRHGNLDKKQLDYLQEIQRACERAIALVNDLLQVSRVQEGKLHLDLGPVEIFHLVEEVIDSNRSLMTTNSISFRLEIINGPLPLLVIDKIKIRRVMQNLLSNAVKYTPKNGNIHIILKNTGKEVIFSITDTGVGIPADQQNKIFQRFFRGSNIIRIQPDGTGLGLFIARSLIEAHKGKIWFESLEGKGSTFYFSLPVQKKQ